MLLTKTRRCTCRSTWNLWTPFWSGSCRISYATRIILVGLFRIKQFVAHLCTGMPAVSTAHHACKHDSGLISAQLCMLQQSKVGSHKQCSWWDSSAGESSLCPNGYCKARWKEH